MHTRLLLVLAVMALVLMVAPDEAAANPSTAAVSRVAEATGDAYEPNDTKGAATPISFSGRIIGATIDPAGDQDFYSFHARAGEYLFAGIRSSGLTVNLYGGAHCATLIASTDSYYIEFLLPDTGDYCLRVRSANHPNEGGADFGYRIDLERGDRYEINDTVATATPVALGQTIEATLHLTLLDYYLGDNDYYTFAGQKGDHVFARIFAEGFFVVKLLGPDGITVIEESLGFAGEYEHLAQATLPVDGIYFLNLQGYEDSSGRWFGDYVMTLDKGELVSSKTAGSVDGIPFDKNDVLLHYTIADRWELLLDLSDIGVTTNLSSFHVLSDGVYSSLGPEGNILMSIQTSQTLLLGYRNMPTVLMPHDILVARLYQTGNDTDGTLFQLFDGSDVGLTTASEKIDAMGVAPDGRLLISTVGGGEVPGAGRFRDEDILAFTPAQWGDDTAGAWSLYFDGSTVPGLAREDVTGLDTGLDGDLYLTLQDNFTVTGVSCGPTCILTVHPNGTAEAFWNGRAHRFPYRLDAIDLPGSAALLSP